MSNNFRVGQKVVCITREWNPARFYLHPNGLPIMGEVYTIREIYQSIVESGPGIRLAEIISARASTPDGIVEIGFRADGFRPAVDFDLSIFTAMLSKTPQEIMREIA